MDPITLNLLGATYIIRQQILTRDKGIGMEQSAGFIPTQAMVDGSEYVFFIIDESQRTKPDAKAQIYRERLDSESGTWARVGGGAGWTGGATATYPGVSIEQSDVDAGAQVRFILDVNGSVSIGGYLGIGIKENPE